MMEEEDDLSEFTDDPESTAVQDRYEIGRILGQGGGGSVYEATDRKIGRKVALKVLSILGSDDRARHRFQVELESIAALEHPHIIPVFDHGSLEGRPFYAMKYVGGGTLAERADDFRDAREIVALMRKITGAVLDAHQHGILHRDLKPGNILLDEDGEPYVSDFGLAKRFTDGKEAEFTLSGSVIGTPAFMSPEQASGDQSSVTVASDIFSLGAILFGLLTGRRAFEGNTTHQILREVIDTDVRFTSGELKKLDKDLTTICLKCLQKNPDLRYNSTGELAREFDRYLRGEPITARPIGSVSRMMRWCRRKPYITTSIALALVTLATFVVSLVLGLRALREAQQETMRQLYYANMTSLQSGSDRLNIGATRAILESASQYEDKGFEWGYWNRRLNHRHEIFEHKNGVHAVAFSPDEALLVTGDRWGVHIWERKTGVVMAAFRVGGSVFDVKFSADGESIVVSQFLNSDDRSPSVHVYDLAGVKRRTLMEGPYKEAIGLSLVPDQPGHIATYGGKGLTIWDYTTGEAVHQLELPRLDSTYGRRYLAFSPDGDRFAISPGLQIRRIEDGEVLVDLLAEANAIARSDGLRNEARQIAFDFSGDRLVVGGSVYDAHTGALISASSLAGSDAPSAFSPDGKFVAVSDEANGIRILFADRVRRPSMERGTSEASFALLGHRSRITRIAYSRNGDWLLSSSEDGTARVWDCREWERRTLLGHDWSDKTRIAGLGMTSDGSRIVTGSDDGTAVVWDRASGGKLLTFRGHAGEISPLEVLPNDREVITGSHDGTAKIWDMQTGKVRLSLEGHKGEIWCVTVSAAGDRVLTGGTDSLAILWDSSSGKPLLHFRAHTGPVSAVAFSPDGRLLVTGSDDRSVIVWDAVTGEQLLTFAAHTSWLGDAQFFPDGERVVTCGDDNVARIWDVRSGEELQVLRGHSGTVLDLAISPDGRRVFTVSGDRTCRVWDVETGRQFLMLLSEFGEFNSVALSGDGHTLAAGAFRAATVWESTDLK